MNSEHNDKDIDYTLDGEEFTTRDRRQPAGEILRNGQLDPAQYDLGELAGQSGQIQRYSDGDEVRIRPGARFVSIRQSAPVA